MSNAPIKHGGNFEQTTSIRAAAKASMDSSTGISYLQKHYVIIVKTFFLRDISSHRNLFLKLQKCGNATRGNIMKW